MSLKKKIIFSFSISALIIALLSAFLYLNFIEIDKESTFLELTDTIRSKSLQLRRHEKNYFLYAPEKAPDESKAIHAYLDELDQILNDRETGRMERTQSLKNLVEEYRRQFSTLENLVRSVSDESNKLKKSSPAYSRVSHLLESNFLDKPLADVTYLLEALSLRSDHALIRWLRELDAEINALRKTGENILTASKELDKTARERMDRFIHASRTAILVIFPLFLIVGIGTFLFIISGVVRRLQLLTNVVVRTGEGDFSRLSVSATGWSDHDEVETLIQKFNTMEEQLMQRERELLRSKKLAAIGTLASGVAHELNNPLNNIYTTAQRLMKRSGNECQPAIQKGLDDIFGQTMRVKKIVGDLLEFARGREPNVRPIELHGLVDGVFRVLGNTVDMNGIHFSSSFHPEEIVLSADPEQIEQVFINLFTNASEAMSGSGALAVGANEEDDHVLIRVTDSGKGMSREMTEKIFEPFYTTKDKGTGLGLAIVFNIIQKHHGDIQVRSEEGKGTSFMIRLPKRYSPAIDKNAGQ